MSGMDALLRYLAESLAGTLSGLFVLFGGTTALAFLLYFASERLRGIGAARFGMAFYRFVAPGIACHETGHAMGCLLTFTKINEFVPYSPQKDGTLGWVAYRARSGIVGALSRVVIGTGPIWFGCLVVAVLTGLLYGFPELPQPVNDELSEQILALFSGAVGFVIHVVTGMPSHPILSILYVYLVFCVVSEMKLSSVDLAGMGGGIFAFVILFALFNFIPFVDVLLTRLVFWAAPHILAVNAVMCAVLLINLILSWLLSLIARR